MNNYIALVSLKLYLVKLVLLSKGPFISIRKVYSKYDKDRPPPFHPIYSQHVVRSQRLFHMYDYAKIVYVF